MKDGGGRCHINRADALLSIHSTILIRPDLEVPATRRCLVTYIDEVRRIGRDANPFFRLMGIEVNDFGDGNARLSMEVRPDMLNGVGWLQGGLYVALADEAIALALCTVLEEGEGIATIDEHTSFLKGVRSGTITATGRVVRKGRRVAFADAEVLDAADGSLLSRTTASFAVVRV
jgi:acyl-CoA thioesterase